LAIKKNRKRAGWCSTDRSGLQQEGGLSLSLLTFTVKGRKGKKNQTAPTVGIRESKAFVVHNRHRERETREIFFSFLPFWLPLFVCVSSSVLPFFFPSGTFVSLRRLCHKKSAVLLLFFIWTAAVDFAFYSNDWMDGGMGWEKTILGKLMVLLAFFGTFIL
jgi:hypothetical protein